MLALSFDFEHFPVEGSSCDVLDDEAANLAPTQHLVNFPLADRLILRVYRLVFALFNHFLALRIPEDVHDAGFLVQLDALHAVHLDESIAVHGGVRVEGIVSDAGL